MEVTLDEIVTENEAVHVLGAFADGEGPGQFGG